MSKKPPLWRVGIGFDLHRLRRGRPFLLGGVRIPHPTGPVGHSDGDVVLHALCDALLGASAGGDIGSRFPDTDPRWRGQKSAYFVRAVWEPLRRAGWTLVNVDTTVFVERPRLGPWKPRIAAALARLVGLPTHRVSVKAKTAEGLGAIGAHQAVMAQVIVGMEKTSTVKRKR